MNQVQLLSQAQLGSKILSAPPSRIIQRDHSAGKLNKLVGSSRGSSNMLDDIMKFCLGAAR